MQQESRQAGKDLIDVEIRQQIIAAALGVHGELGPRFLEGIYEGALAVEHRLGFRLEDKIVIAKAISSLEDIHFAISGSYVEATGLHDGLLFNFAIAPPATNRFCREVLQGDSPPDLHA
jgi:hypothetical protein